MKIGILTQPLGTNYGGLLQNYALQTVLKREGYDVLTVQRTSPSHDSIKFLSVLKRTMFCQSPKRVWPTAAEQSIIGRHTDRFIKENILVTPPLFIEKDKLFRSYGFDAYIVGSDQVWRPRYNDKQSQMFLDFTQNSSVKRIAYAASFGVDDWEFSDEETIRYAALLKRFDWISVREDVAVALCKQYFKTDATHVLDPTLLLNKEDYIRLIEKDQIPEKHNILMAYVLDRSEEKQNIVKRVATHLHLDPLSIMPRHSFYEVGSKGLDDCIFPPVTEWLRGFMDADFVVTDSFHGTAFSIIFNKPFIAIGNAERGISRFTSLLRLFHLEDRLISSIDDITDDLLDKSVNYSSVNAMREARQNKDMSLLIKTLQQ